MSRACADDQDSVTASAEDLPMSVATMRSRHSFAIDDYSIGKYALFMAPKEDV